MDCTQTFPKLGECRTWGGEREQAALDCYTAKALPVKYQITAHRPWHVAQQVCHSTDCKSV